MDLTLILGPMKSGKSLELISLLSPLRYSNTTHRIYQSARHVRDAGVDTRTGGALTTTKVVDLSEARAEEVEVVGVDEVHMFSLSDVAVVAELLSRGTRVVAAGLDLDHRGELFAPVKALLELGPATVTYRRSVCDRCRTFNATHTQVLASGTPFVEPLGRSQALPDDGTFTYEARCRSCFVGEPTLMDSPARKTA
jgi:thymidine kinase